MAAQHQQPAAEQRQEARRVSVIFGLLTLFTVWPMAALIALVLAVTTGNGAQGMAVGLIPATLLAVACGVSVARRTWSNLRPAPRPLLKLVPSAK
jgi:hypothetical protein